jgi:hypothetical protein
VVENRLTVPAEETQVMSIEPNLYVCRLCGAEVKIIRKTVPDPKCPTLFCCGKLMTTKELPSVTTELDAKTVVKARYDAFAERGGAAACCVGETPPSRSFAAEHGLYSREELSRVPQTAFTLSRGCGNPLGFSDVRPGEVVVDIGVVPASTLSLQPSRSAQVEKWCAWISLRI